MTDRGRFHSARASTSAPVGEGLRRDTCTAPEELFAVQFCRESLEKAQLPSPRKDAQPPPPAGPRNPNGPRPVRWETRRRTWSTPVDGERRFTLGVVEQEEALVAYRGLPTSHSTDSMFEPSLRVPLLLCAASLLADDACGVSVTLPRPDEFECFRGMQVSPCERHSRFQQPALLPEGQTSFHMRCETEEEARRLLDQLVAAGCSMHCFSRRYRLKKWISHRSACSTYLAKDTWSGEYVDVKIFTQKRKGFHPLQECSMLRWAKCSVLPAFKAVCKLSAADLAKLPAKHFKNVDEACSGIALVTEHIHGIDLGKILEGGSVPEECAELVMRSVFGALAVLHGRGIICRGLKPEKVLLSEDGFSARLMDLELACFEWDEESTKAKVGHVGYLAPEIYIQPPQTQTAKVDCFSAGALLYACFVGKGPFSSGTTAGIMRKNVHNRLNVEALATIPRLARALVAGLMHTKPEDRLTAAECLNDTWLAKPDDGMGASSSAAPSLSDSDGTEESDGALLDTIYNSAESMEDELAKIDLVEPPKSRDGSRSARLTVPRRRHHARHARGVGMGDDITHPSGHPSGSGSKSKEEPEAPLEERVSGVCAVGSVEHVGASGTQESLPPARLPSQESMVRNSFSDRRRRTLSKEVAREATRAASGAASAAVRSLRRPFRQSTAPEAGEKADSSSSGARYSASPTDGEEKAAATGPSGDASLAPNQVESIERLSFQGLFKSYLPRGFQRRSSKIATSTSRGEDFSALVSND